MAHLIRDRNTCLEVAGTIGMSSSKRSLKITVNDPDKAFEESYYVSIRDVQTILAQPSKVAQIVKVKRMDSNANTNNP